MKLDSSITAEDIERQLRMQAEAIYGAERTEELADQINEHARVMATLAQAELDLRDAPPDTSGIMDRGAR